MKYVCMVCSHTFKKNSDTAWQQCPQCSGDAWWEDSGYIKGTISTPVVPSWRKYEQAMRTGTMADQLRAADAFSSERDKEVKSNPRMERWENSRKEYFRKLKGSWVRKEKARLRSKGL